MGGDIEGEDMEGKQGWEGREGVRSWLVDVGGARGEGQRWGRGGGKDGVRVGIKSMEECGLKSMREIL